MELLSWSYLCEQETCVARLKQGKCYEDPGIAAKYTLC